MSLKTEFPNADQFLGAYFPDADFDELSDEDVVNKFLSDVSSHPVIIQRTLSELNDLLVKMDIYWKDVSDNTNVYFETKQEAKAWLHSIIDFLIKDIKH